MMEPIAFDDIEVAFADYLASMLSDHGEDIPVLLAVPAERPTRFVRLVRVGGSTSNLITDRPRVVFECWDTLGVNAAALARIVRALVGACAPGFVGSVWVDKSRDLGVVYSPDPDTGIPRYLVTAELYVTGKALS